VIVAAIVRRGDDVLLVFQQGPDDPVPSWALPGGVAEGAESLLDALRREIREETGLELAGIGPLAYVTQTVSSPDAVSSGGDLPKPGEMATAFVFEAVAGPGEPLPNDPDDFIRQVAFVAPAEAIERLESLPWRVMREPAVAALRGQTAAGAYWLYRRGSDGVDALVSRVDAKPARGPSSAQRITFPGIRARRPASDTPAARQSRALLGLGCLALFILFSLLIIIGIIATVH
jgi:8-oxo-dGTP diphosphatase